MARNLAERSLSNSGQLLHDPSENTALSGGSAALRGCYQRGMGGRKDTFHDRDRAAEYTGDSNTEKYLALVSFRQHHMSTCVVFRVLHTVSLEDEICTPLACISAIAARVVEASNPFAASVRRTTS